MNTRIYIGNLSARVTETDLEDEFKKFGYVRNVWIARQPPGFAFVVMEDGRDAEDAIRKLDGLSGWKVEYARHDGTRRQDRNRSGPLSPHFNGDSGQFKRDYRMRRPPRGSRYSRNWNSDRSSPVYGGRSRSRSRDRSHRERSWSGGRAGSYERSRRKGGSIAATPTKASKSRERSRSISPLKSTKSAATEEKQQEQLTKSRSGNGGYPPQRTPSKETTVLPAIGAGAGGD